MQCWSWCSVNLVNKVKYNISSFYRSCPPRTRHVGYFLSNSIWSTVTSSHNYSYDYVFHVYVVVPMVDLVSRYVANSIVLIKVCIVLCWDIDVTCR